MAADLLHVEYLTRQLADRVGFLESKVSALQDTLDDRAALNESILTSHSAQVDVLAGHTALLAQLADQLQAVDRHVTALVRRVAVTAEPGSLLVRTEVGYVVVDSSDSAMVAHLLHHGEVEPGVRHLIQRLVSVGDTFVDAGANIGLHTLAASRCVGDEGRVVAIEPFATTATNLRRTLYLNGLTTIVELHEVAVSNSSDEVNLFLGGTAGHHSMYAPPGVDLESTRVATATIDSIVGGRAPVTVVKLDVEGAELEAIDGMRNTIAANPGIALIVEFGPSHLERAGRTSDEWFGTIAELDFEFRRINDESGRLEQVTTEELNAAHSTNLLIASADSPAWDRAER